MLTDNILESLIQYLPPPDQLKRLTELKVDYSELTEAEQFAYTVSTSEVTVVLGILGTSCYTDFCWGLSTELCYICNKL